MWLVRKTLQTKILVIEEQQQQKKHINARIKLCCLWKKNRGSLGNCFNELRMKKFIIKFFLTGYNFMLELHLRQPGFTYCACGLYTKHHERISKFVETGDLKNLYRNELDKACLAHDASYSDSKVFS